MADYRYPEPPPYQPTLQDVLLGAQSSAAAPQAGTADTGMAPEERQRLIDLLTQPEDVGPAPTVDKPNALALLFSGLGDALAGMNAGRTGNPGFRTDYTGQYVGGLAQQKQALQDYQQQVARSQNRATERKASFLLSEADKKELAKQAAADKQAAQKAMIDERNFAIRQQRDAKDAALAQDQAQFEAQKTWEREREGVRFQHDKVIAGIRERAQNGDKSAEEDKKALGGSKGIYATINALAATAPQNLSEGKTTPEELQSLVENEIDQGLLSPDGRKAAMLYMQNKFAQVFKDHQANQMNKSLEAGSPDPEQMGGLGSLWTGNALPAQTGQILSTKGP